MRFKKKPVEIEAIQWKGEWMPVEHFLDRVGNKRLIRQFGDELEIKTLEGTMTAAYGDWLICGVKGELYPCKPDIFEATYDPVT